MHYTVFDIYAMYDVCTNWIVSIVCVLYKCILRSTSWGPMKNWKMMVSKRKFSVKPKKLPVFGEDSCSSWSGEWAPVLMSKDYGQSEPASLDMAFTLKKWSNGKSFAKRRKRPYSILGVGGHVWFWLLNQSHNIAEPHNVCGEAADADIQ